MKRCWILLVACGGGTPVPPAPIEPAVTRVFREVLIHASGDSQRTTYELETVGDDAKLTVTREVSSATRLDMPTAWAMVERATYFGPIRGQLDGSARVSDIALVDANGRGIRLACEPINEQVMPAHARLAGRDSDCARTEPMAWAPATIEHVAALVCQQESSQRTLAFVDAPGVEYVEEKTDCKVFGSGLRRR